MSDMPKNLIRNFAGFAYRESAVLTEQFGEGAIRRATIQTWDGHEVLLETKGGMPRVTALKNDKRGGICAGLISPLTETDESLRTYWEPEGENKDERRFSVDGLLSLPRRIVKTIKVASATTTLWPSKLLHFCFGDPSKEINPEPFGVMVSGSDLVEASRTLETDPSKIPAWFVRGLAFVSKECIKSISFTRGICPPVVLNFDLALRAPHGAHDQVAGSYDVTTEAPLPAGSDTLDFFSDGKRLTVKLEKDQAFLEPYSYKVLPALREGGMVLPEMDPSAKLPGAFFSLDKWGSPFKYFAHRTGLYVDEHRAVKISLPDPGEGFPYTASETSPARYFKFGAERGVQIEGTDCAIKNDIQFNQGVSFPGGYPVMLGGNEHLYKDPKGAVWRIQFSYQQVTDYSVSVTATLIERVDTFLDAGEEDVSREIKKQTFVQKVPGDYPQLKGFSGMFVDSLPNGKEASIAINAPPDEKSPDRGPESVIILLCAFSGTGGTTGAGITMTFLQMPTVLISRSTTEAIPSWMQVVDTYPTFIGGAPPEGGCACEVRSSDHVDGNGQMVYRWDAETMLFKYAHCSQQARMAFHPPWLSYAETPVNSKRRIVGTLVANIQLVARAGNSWDMLQMEYENEYLQETSKLIVYEDIQEFIYYCGAPNANWFDVENFRGSGAVVRSERAFNEKFDGRVEESTRETITYSCGEAALTGFVNYTPTKDTTNALSTGKAGITPLDDSIGTWSMRRKIVNNEESSVETPFLKHMLTRSRVSPSEMDSPIRSSAGTNALGEWKVSGAFGPHEKITIDPAHVAGNVHVINYIFEDGGAGDPRTTTEELVHGVFVEKAKTGETVCDDPRNSRVVVLPTADAGLFF